MKQRHSKLITIVLIVSAVFFWVVVAQAQEKSVVEEILDILLANHQISQKQYQYLLKKAKAEEKARAQRNEVKSVTEEKHPEETIELSRSSNKEDNKTKINTYWNDGLKFETEDKQFSLIIGGKIHYDWGYIDEDDSVGELLGEEFGSGSRMRRARLYVTGILYDDIDFKAEYGFSGGEVEVKDLYLGMKNIPYVGSLRVGHTKEPFSLEELTSGSDVTFMERSLPNALVPCRNIGFLAHNFAFNKRLNWSFGAFSETDNKGNGFGEDDRYNLTARITTLPWYKDDGKDLLLFGVSYSHKFMDEGSEINYGERPESHLTSVRFVDTNPISSDGIDLVGTETAFVLDSFSLQSEYIHAFVNPEAGNNLDFDGFYIYGSYFLTGEHRPYDTTKEVFGRVKPKRNFKLARQGRGAWELGFRYSYLDLNDGEVHGGILNEYTAGLNWYLNPNSRIMFNYIHSHLNDIGDADIFQSRFQLDF